MRRRPDRLSRRGRGVLVYFKSSVTGDEKDYILDYKRRNPSFPHETTTDQFFTEEQFEAYRALGFHMVDHAFDERRSHLMERRRGRLSSLQQALDAIDEALPIAPELERRRQAGSRDANAVDRQDNKA